MKIKEKSDIENVVGYICDVCKKSCDKGDPGFESHEWAELNATWGYYSNKDLQIHECHMCETCYDLVANFIKSIGGNIRVRYYGSPSIATDFEENVDYIFREKNENQTIICI